MGNPMNITQVSKAAASIFMALAIGVVIAKYVPGFSVPGNAQDWALLAIASAIVGAT